MVLGNFKEKTAGRIILVNVGEIRPNPHQPRKYFDELEMESLSESIRRNGILQPLTVRRKGEEYELVSGERRLRAAILAGFESVPCIVTEVTERNSALLAILEDVQREDLTFFEEAAAIRRLMDFYGMTQEDAAVKLGKAQSTIANKLRLLRFNENQMKRIESGGLTERHARAILKAPQPMRDDVIERVIKFTLNVEHTEKMIDTMMKDDARRRSIAKRKGAFRDVRLFVNTINKAVETMKAAGINAASEKKQCDGYIEYIVRIPQNN